MTVVRSRVKTMTRTQHGPRIALVALVAMVGAPGMSRAQDEPASGDVGETSVEDAGPVDGIDPVEDAGPVDPTSLGLGITFGAANPPVPEEEQILESLKKDYDIYQEAALEYQVLVNNILEVEYEKRKVLVEKEYSALIGEEERLEDEARLSAIEYFEAFLEKYPNHPTYTPDAMFRLSELYYEQSYVEYDEATDALAEAEEEYKKQLALFEAGKLTTEPVKPEAPVREFARSTELYVKLIEQFPDYRNIDGVFYLLGYCYNEMGEFDAALYAWLGLVCANKEPYFSGKGLESQEDDEESDEDHPSASMSSVSSAGVADTEAVFAVDATSRYQGCEIVKEGSRFFTETWLRIGEYHFDFDYSADGLANAISAYTEAIKDESSDFFDLALYKLAWSHWRNNDYLTAIRYFVQVVEYSDRKAAETGKSGSELRPEAVQYIAFSFWEADWNGDMIDDGVPGLDRLRDPKYIDQSLPWLSEVYLALGSTYLDDNQNNRAIEVYKAYLENPQWANALEAPEVVQKIIEAYDKEQNEQAKIEMIAKLSEYGPESEWAKINKDHPQTVLKVSSAAQDALMATALKHHETAQNFKSVGMSKTDPAEKAQWLADAKLQYKLAADSYKEYLGLYPNTPDSYEMNYNLAEALFWSGSYTEAAEQYLAVRDSQLDNNNQRDAAEMLIQSYLMIKQSDTTLDIRSEPPEVSVGPGGTPGVPTYPIPEVMEKLIDAQQMYLKLFPSDTDNAPAFAFLAAETSFNYGHWDEARTQYQKIYDTYCYNDIIAVYAWTNLTFMAAKLEDIGESESLALMQKEKQCTPVEIPEDKKQEWADAIAGANTKAADIIIAKEAKDIMDTFFRAQEENDPALWEEAAQGLLKLYDREPTGKEADKILWNAVLAYESCNKPQSALKVVTKLVENHPESEFMGDALFKLALNAFNSFDYEQSLTQFKIIADDARFKDSPHREPAIQNTALIFENKQKYTQAAEYWKKYGDFTKDKKKAMDAAWRAAKCYVKNGNWSQVESEMKSFVTKFSGVKEAAELRVEARWYIALSFKERKKPTDFKKSLPAVVEAYKDWAKQGETDPTAKATDYAAEAKFLLVENELPTLEKFTLHVDKPAEKVLKEIEDLKVIRDKIIDQYNEVKNYGSKSWTVAALFRIGYCYDMHAKIIIESPIPKSLDKLPDDIKWDAIDAYQQQINSLVFPIEDSAKLGYENAYKVSQVAGVMNTWTELTLERLNAYDPDNYPLYKKGQVKDMGLFYLMPSMDLSAPGAAGTGEEASPAGEGG